MMTAEADPHADLTRGGTRQELAERDQIRVGSLAEPAPPRDELVAEICDVGDRAAEAGQTEAEEDGEQEEEARQSAGARVGIVRGRPLLHDRGLQASATCR